MVMYSEIQERIDIEFERFITELFTIAGAPRKYFYWSVEFFETVAQLSFRHFQLNLSQKDRINLLGDKYFENDEVQFSINKNSHRNDILIKNIHKLFSDEKKAGQSVKYEYIKEYILWVLLQNEKDNLTIEIENLKSEFVNRIEGEFETMKDELTYFTEIIKKQKSNFLITYISYLCSEHSKPIHKFFTKDYINYLLTNQGEELTKKLEENTTYDNSKLKNKISRLYIHRQVESKIHFVFSRIGGGEKEELRELLEIMGKKDTGKLYRGQADSSWNLDASITREPKYKSNEAEMYYDILSLKPDAFQNDKSVYERLITMQHFGMPTRLLDITRNPLVAIFFACNNFERKDVDGTIYTFEPPANKADFLNFEDKRLEYLPILFNQTLPEAVQSEADKFLSKIWLIKGVAKNQRINNQSGDFIFVGNGDLVKNDLHKLPKMTIIIDSVTKKVLLEQLESLNIHGGAVYPDLTHMSNYIRNKYANGEVSVSISELMKKVNKDEIEEVAKQPVKKTTRKTINIEKFDFQSIKEKSKEEQINSFSQFYNIDETGLTKLIDDFLFTERMPFRDEVAKIMNDNPSILKEKGRIDATLDNITTLAKLVSGKQE